MPHDPKPANLHARFDLDADAIVEHVTRR
jgi:hypothetical protein